MSIVRKIKRAVRGEVSAKTAALEALRQGRVALSRSRERAKLQQGEEQAARLRAPFASMTPSELLDHFRNRSQPHFLPGFQLTEPSAVAPDAGANSGVNEPRRLVFPRQSDELLARAEQIISEHKWPILGLGQMSFGADINWLRDPVSGVTWPLDYHADVNLNRGDGSDVRVLWELNRLPHLVTLACAYSVSGDERLSTEFLRHLESWRSQNTYGYGPNWNCAMEVALRAINLLGAFEIFRHSTLLDEQMLSAVLALFNQHGTFIRQNLEFSYVVTSNHYLSDVAGLLWLGLMLPELEAAVAWREFGLHEMLREMDKQVLSDGADFESSTGYHRFVLELFLFSFILCRANEIEIEERYWDKLRSMLNYVRAYLRPDGRAPLIGDSDGGQAFPISARDADDHAYVLAVGAVVFKDAGLMPAGLVMPEESAGKTNSARSQRPMRLGGECFSTETNRGDAESAEITKRKGLPPDTEEVLWILGEQGVRDYEELKSTETRASSAGFADAGIYVLRDEDLYLTFNATAAGIGGRGSHGHNDALSIGVSAGGVAFIVDPGTYVYTADLKERHRFRSTAYHSTVEIDGTEQNTTDEQFPFVIGNEAKPQVLSWETGDEIDRVSAEHFGYRRLPQPVTHRRTVTFHKQQRWWLVEDEFQGSGKHNFAARFHLNPGIEVNLEGDTSVVAYDKATGAKLFIKSLDLLERPEFEPQFTSRNYYEKTSSITACWQVRAEAPCTFRWILIPTAASENPQIPQIGRESVIQRSNFSFS